MRGALIPVAFDLRDPVRSGIARVARSLARAFAEQSQGRFRITLAGPRDKLEALGAPTWSPDVAGIVDWPCGRYSVRGQLDWNRVRASVGDAVWYFPHWDVPWSSLPARSIVTVHDVGHLRREVAPWHRGLIALAWMRRALHGAARVTTVSEFSRREIVNHWPALAGKIEVVPNGVDPLFFTAPVASASSSIAAKQPFMLSVGNLKRHKNLVIGPEVLARMPALRWVVVGEWFADWKAVERRARELGVGDRITYVGEVSDDELNALYHQAACLFFPSRYEGFGLPILEALAAGTPVVASDAAALAETLGDAGWICKHDDPGAFAVAVTAALAAGPSARARGTARASRYSWAHSAARLATTVEALHAL